MASFKPLSGIHLARTLQDGAQYGQVVSFKPLSGIHLARTYAYGSDISTMNWFQTPIGNSSRAHTFTTQND